MTVIRLAAAALCGVLLCLAPARFQARAAEGSPPAVETDAATWGLYARLAGSAPREAADGFRLQWRWTQPGAELVEEYFNRAGRLVQSATIVPGATPATLVMTSSALGGKQWNGTVQPDGSVVYIGSGLLKMHSKMMLAADGAFEVRPVKLRNGAVVSVGEAAASSRYLPVDEDGVARAADAAAPAASGVLSAPSSPSAPADADPPHVPTVAAAAPAPPSADEAVWGIYARLVGTTHASKHDRGAWRWGPDNSILESRAMGCPLAIRPGDAPGQLVAECRNSSLHVFDGRIAEDGSVTWIRRGRFVKSPTRMRLQDGKLVEEFLKLDRQEQVVGISRTVEFDLVATGAATPTPALAAQATEQGAASAPVDVAAGSRDLPIEGSSPASPARSATVAAAAPAPPPAAPPSFGMLDAFVDRPMVGNSIYGALFKLDVRRQGNELVLQRSWSNGVPYGRIVLRATGVPGAFEVPEVWEEATNGERTAFLVGSPGDPDETWLNRDHADRLKPGRLVLEYDIPGGHMVLVFWQEGDGLSYEQFGGNRRFGIRGAIGVPGYDNLAWFTPATDSAEERAAAFAQSQSTRLAQEREDAERDRAEAQGRAQAALYDSLVQANEIATANEARSRAALEETLEQAARQAGYEQQPAAPSHSAQEVENARLATERQHEISRQFQSREQAQPPIQTVQGGDAGSARAGAQASTRDRADTCVGQPVTSAHQCGSRAGLKGRVANSCAAPVDVRMCFMTGTGWSCQANYGLDPEDAWEPGDCGATGQVFRSVRYSDSNEPLASP